MKLYFAFYPVIIIPSLLHTNLFYMVRLQRGQGGEAWESFKQQ
jgi:hypothetical protein